MLKEFKEFAIKGSVVDMAVGIIIGAAFTGVVQSLVKDVLMPPLGMLMGGMDFSEFFIVLKEGSIPPPYATVAAAQEVGAVTLNYGVFFNATISFLIVSFAVFILIRYINKLKRPEEKPEPVVSSIKKCPYCFSDISVQATRCPHCTSELKE
ncbi:MAG: large conductance mechanosensitive channel protein MscL [Bacteroidota bacterium]